MKKNFFHIEKYISLFDIFIFIKNFIYNFKLFNLICKKSLVINGINFSNVYKNLFYFH